MPPSREVIQKLRLDALRASLVEVQGKDAEI